MTYKTGNNSNIHYSHSQPWKINDRDMLNKCFRHVRQRTFLVSRLAFPWFAVSTNSCAVIPRLESIPSRRHSSASSIAITVTRPGLHLRPVDQHSSIVWPKNLNHQLPSFVAASVFLLSFLLSPHWPPRVRICKWKIHQCASVVLPRNSIATEEEKLQ